MPSIHPEGWRHIPAAGALARKLETLATLEAQLPADVVVHHGIHWTHHGHEQRLLGALDFIVIGPGGRLLLIEQVGGFLEESPDGLLKKHLRASRNISTSLARCAESLRNRLGAVLDEAPTVEVLLYCPDYQVRDPASAGLDAQHIVDARRREQLSRVIHAMVHDDEPDSARVQRIQRFLADVLELVPEVNALVGQAEAIYTRLAGGLTEWARRLELHPHRLRVTGTAGSGKTQLALAVLRDAAAAGRRPLYVCYNRPLADHIARIAPSGAQVASYHQLCDRMLRRAGHEPDFSAPGAFTQLETDFARLECQPEWDELIIDEGQDFRADWRDALLRLLRPEGRAWWLEDPLQNLYDRPPVALPGWAGLTSDCNYRSPADIIGLLAQLPGFAAHGLASASPLAASEVEILPWEDEHGLFDQTRRAITRAIGLGYKREHIALITFRGRENSRFTQLERLGQHRLKAFSGAYDLLGSPIYSDGELLIDSVHRFKGQAAPCVIFTEIDCENASERDLRKLFVGATRASMKLILVASRRAQRAFGLAGSQDRHSRIT